MCFNTRLQRNFCENGKLLHPKFVEQVNLPTVIFSIDLKRVIIIIYYRLGVRFVRDSALCVLFWTRNALKIHPMITESNISSSWTVFVTLPHFNHGKIITTQILLLLISNGFISHANVRPTWLTSYKSKTILFLYLPSLATSVVKRQCKSVCSRALMRILTIIMW